jgi:hypothetical protein
VLTGVVIVAGGIGVALVERLRFPRGSIWIVVAATLALVVLIRALTAPKS